MRGIGEWATQRARLSGDRIAFVSGGRSWTYREFEDRTNPAGEPAPGSVRCQARRPDRRGDTHVGGMSRDPVRRLEARRDLLADQCSLRRARNQLPAG